MDGDRPDPPPAGGRGDPDQRPLTAKLDVNPDNATFVTIHALGDTPLSKVSPFIIKKVIDYHAGEVDSVRKLNSGDLLVKTISPSQIKKLM